MYGGIIVYKILLCCMSGLTTTMLVNAMKKEAHRQNIDVMIWTAISSAIELSWAEADCILIAPQNAGDLEKVRSIVKTSIPIAVIEEKDLLEMNGKAVLKQANNLFVLSKISVPAINLSYSLYIIFPLFHRVISKCSNYSSIDILLHTLDFTIAKKD